MKTSLGKSAFLASTLLLGVCGAAYHIVPAETYRKCRAYAESTEETLAEGPMVCRSWHGAIRVPPLLGILLW